MISSKWRICAGRAEVWARATVRGRYEAVYERCRRCGYVQIGDPHWLEEAYQSRDAGDTGLIARCMNNSVRTFAFISFFLDPRGRFLDFGAGAGVFVRLMRDRGLDFYWYDRYEKNVFAMGFERGSARGEMYDAITAFEVAEHLVEPIPTFNQLANQTDHILFSTELMPYPPPRPDQWWYYGLDHGKHVGFYTRSSLEWIAGACQMRLYSDERGLHLMSRRRWRVDPMSLVSKFWFRRCAEIAGRVRGPWVSDSSRRSQGLPR